MMDAIHEAGWVVFPVLAVGVVALIVGGWHALHPERRLAPLAVGLIAATVALGVLGTILGLQHSAMGIADAPPDKRWIFLIGLKESLFNLDFALALAVPAMLLAAVGSFRRATIEAER